MFKIYQVGGSVRDMLMGVECKDIDFVAVPDENLIDTTPSIEVMLEILVKDLERLGYEIFLVTPSCFTIRAKFPKTHINAGLVADFVLARKETGYKEGTREPIVEPGSLTDDLMRRDFTVNAIAMDEDGTIYDPFGGRRDIKKKLLRTPISGELTFEADPLRLLRAVRFAITKEFILSPTIDTLLITYDYQKGFEGIVSEERIREELYKCFKYSTGDTISFLYRYTNLRYYIFNKTNLWLKPTNEKR